MSDWARKREREREREIGGGGERGTPIYRQINTAGEGTIDRERDREKEREREREKEI